MFDTYEEIKGCIVTLFKKAGEPLATPDIQHYLTRNHGEALPGSYGLEHALSRMAEEGLLARAHMADCQTTFGWTPTAVTGRPSLTVYWALATMVHRPAEEHQRFTCRPECCHHVDQTVQRETVRNIVERSGRPLTARDVTSIILRSSCCSRADLYNRTLMQRVAKLLEGLDAGGRLVVALYPDHQSVFGCAPQQSAAPSIGRRNARFWWSTACTPKRVLQSI